MKRDVRDRWRRAAVLAQPQVEVERNVGVRPGRNSTDELDAPPHPTVLRTAKRERAARRARAQNCRRDVERGAAALRPASTRALSRAWPSQCSSPGAARA